MGKGLIALIISIIITRKRYFTIRAGERSREEKCINKKAPSKRRMLSDIVPQFETLA